jgi:hypothetical protein
MTAMPHPVTGVLINSISLVRYGPITLEERQTAALLLAEGHPRWIVAAMLGRFPLAFTGAGRSPRGYRPKGSHLSLGEARRDQRQMTLIETPRGHDSRPG